MTATKRLFIKTYGCQMNAYDSERMAEAMAGAGYVAAPDPEHADMIILNTCHIREKAAEKVYSELGRLRPLKTENPDLKIAVAGCVAQAEGEEIVRRQPLVDVVVGPQAYHRLPELTEGSRGNGAVVDTDFPVDNKFGHLGHRGQGRVAPSSFLTVQEGCDKFCSFCVVPYTRGAEASRDADEVLAEAIDLVSRGAREITLLGQNVNAYRGHPDGLAGLIWALNELSGLERIRFTTSHPKDMSNPLIEAIGTCPKLMPYLHLPVQSGSDRMLRAMNRKHTADEYRRVIDRVRAARPDILLSGDFIVGFPGESEDDFAATLDLVRSVVYGQSYSFKYSARPGTPAAERDTVPEEIKKDRLDRLQALLRRQHTEAQVSMVGKTASVLLEKPGKTKDQLVGRSEHFHAVHVSASGLKPGMIVPIRILERFSNFLSGVVDGDAR